MEYLARAQAIIDGNAGEIRCKILTLGQLRKSGRSQLYGKKGEELWADGERVLAFEDGTVAFKESGSVLWMPEDKPEGLAEWIRFLNGLHENWESMPPPKLPLSGSGGMVDLSTSD